MKPKHMKTYPKVTIMIPTYNQEDYIGEAIESSLNQDYPNLEVIVSDDFSKDKTGIIAKKYETDTRFRYFRNARNLGRVGNYHHTLYDLATGEWVINLDGDDFYTDNRYISRLMKYVSSDPKIVCCHALHGFSQNIKDLAIKCIAKDTYILDGVEYFKNLFHGAYFSHLGALYKRELALKDGKCYTYSGIQSDFHGVIRYSVLGHVVVTIDDAYFWRIHGNNETFSQNNLAKYKSERLCQYLIIEDLPENSLTDYEKKQWLIYGKQSAKRQYIIDCLCLSPSMASLSKGICNYRFKWSYNVILIKTMLRVMGFNIKI